MTTTIQKIRQRNAIRLKIKAPHAEPPAKRTTLADSPAARSPREPAPSDATSHAEPALSLPPPLPCLLCDCPAIWSTIYEPAAFRCCDCEPPPGGWSHRTGGWRFVARRLLLAIWNGVWEWESFPAMSFRD